jgi:molybdate transport system ATP-binding protein
VDSPTLALDVEIALGALRRAVRIETDAHRIGLVGPSGVGKTTVLRIVAGVETRARGVVASTGSVWQDSATARFVPAWQRRCGWVPQDARLFPHRTVRENLAWAMNVSATDELATVAEALAIAPLLDRAPRHLSGGERQRVALGRALLARPSLLLLDEPFAALDRVMRARVAGWLRERCDRDALPIVLVSHLDADLAALVDEVHELD